MDITSIEDKVGDVLKAGADSVVLYRLPFAEGKVLHLGKALLMDSLNGDCLVNDGFIVYPFNVGESKIIWVSQECKYAYTGKLTDDLSSQLLCLFGEHLKQDNAEETGFEEYQSQFTTMHQAILNGELDKVILSRLKEVKAFDVSRVIDVFDELCSMYEHAFVYAFVSPSSGIWIGAGPEILLQKQADDFQTISLAGTLPNNDGLTWSKKELDEQDVVTRYMKNVLNVNGINKCECVGPYQVGAGQVKHLRTDFCFKGGQIKYGVGNLLMQLHPTPAVCGMPKNKAVDLITKVEPHKREYYAGFLGPVSQSDFSFYVNIRCLKLNLSNTALFLGGGLTSGSNLESEWDETGLKAQTLLSVLKNIANLQAYE